MNSELGGKLEIVTVLFHKKVQIVIYHHPPPPPPPPTDRHTKHKIELKHFCTKALHSGHGACDFTLVNWSRIPLVVVLVLPVHRCLDDSVLPFALDPAGHSCDQCCTLSASIL